MTTTEPIDRMTTLPDGAALQVSDYRGEHTGMPIELALRHPSRVAGLVLNDPDSVSVSRSNISCFTVDAAGQLHFLRPRGVGDSPISSVLHGEVYGKRLA